MAMTIDDVKTVLVLGAGTMGARISLACAMHGYDVIIYEVSEAALQGLEFRFRMMGLFWEQEGKTTQQAVEGSMSRITTTSDAAEAAADADLLIEAIPEKPALKHEVFARFDELCPEKTVFATNTSSLLPREIETAVKRKDRFAALHFHGYKSVADIMAGTQTSEHTIELLREFARSIGEVPVVMKKENPGYLHNYMFIVWLEAAMWLAAGGFGSIEDIDRSWMKVHDARMGPFGALDIGGLDVAMDVGEAMRDRGQPGHWDEMRGFLQAYIDKGHLGLKTGRGFYTYPNPAYARPGFLEGE